MKKLVVGLCCLASCVSYAQTDGTRAMMDLKAAIEKQDYANLSAEEAKAAISGAASASISANRAQTAPSSFTADMSQKADEWQKVAREALVAAYPPRDQARARQILIGNGDDKESPGKLYYFVSRSMPAGLLRAYALDAFYAGGTLVVKGVRKGDTIKEYVEEAIADYNSADGLLLSGIEINPNLYDIFDVKVVPTVVWTTKSMLDEGNSGCEQPSSLINPKITVEGPDDEPLIVDKPTCMQAHPDTYYKIAGAVNSHYVFDRFQEAGAPKEKMDSLRRKLSRKKENVTAAAEQDRDHALVAIPQGFKLGDYPIDLLRSWQSQLQSHNVQRTPLGPNFDNERSDDAAYRAELINKINKGLSGAE